MEGIARDVHHALRSLRRTPGFTLAVVLILGVGIGMATAMFTVFKTVLVDRLPIADQDRVVVMHTLDRSGRNLDAPYSFLEEIARDSALFRGVAGVYHLGAPKQPLLDGSTLIQVGMAGTSPNYFDVLGMRPVLGRFLRSEDAEEGAPLVMVLSYGMWRRDFAGDPAIVGRSLVIPYSRRRVRIVGVAPAGFEYPTGADAWMPIPRQLKSLQVDIVARLAPGVSIDAARAGVFAVTQHVGPPPEDKSFRIWGVSARSLADTVLGASRPALVALTLAVALLLLIACVNIGNLMLVRLLGRTREIAVRRALGATWGDVARLFSAEAAILGTLGGALGFLAAGAALRLVRAAAPPGLPRADALGSAGVPVVATVGLSLLAVLVFGGLPSVAASRIPSYAALRSDSRSGMESRSRRQARTWLVSMQIALAVVMLSGAGLLVRTLARLETMDLGYRPQHLSVLSFSGTQSALPTPGRAFEVEKQLVASIEAMPGVVAATPIEQDPFKGQAFYIMKLAHVGQPVPERDQDPFVPFEIVGADYFRAFHIQLLRGRGFTAGDTRTSEKVVVVNETLAKQLWRDGEALGRRIVNLTGPVADTGRVWTVVGVARDTRFRELKNVVPVAYFDWDQLDMPPSGLVAVRTTGTLAAMLPSLRAAAREVNPDLVLWDARTMDELLDAPLAQPRLSALLLTAFSLVALLLSAIGLYGVLSSGVRQQTRDIGVRVALGATPGAIRRFVLHQVSRIVGAGLLAGLVSALAGSRLLRSLLYEVSPTDPLTLAGVCVLLLGVAAVAAYLPARRATRVDPVEALRAE